MFHCSVSPIVRPNGILLKKAHILSQTNFLATCRARFLIVDQYRRQVYHRADYPVSGKSEDLFAQVQ